MTLKTLQSAKIEAMKNKDTIRKDAIGAMIDTIQKASITPKGRIEITEQLIDETLIKYQKIIQEMINTCPANRIDLLEKYNKEMSVVREFVPQLITDKDKIISIVKETLDGKIDLVKSNRGVIMKTIIPVFKGKADMKIVNEVIENILV